MWDQCAVDSLMWKILGHIHQYLPFYLKFLHVWGHTNKIGNIQQHKETPQKLVNVQNMNLKLSGYRGWMWQKSVSWKIESLHSECWVEKNETEGLRRYYRKKVCIHGWWMRPAEFVYFSYACTVHKHIFKLLSDWVSMSGVICIALGLFSQSSNKY